MKISYSGNELRVLSYLDGCNISDTFLYNHTMWSMINAMGSIYVCPFSQYRRHVVYSKMKARLLIASIVS